MAELAIENLNKTVRPNDPDNAEPIYVKYADEEGSKKRLSGGGRKKNHSGIKKHSSHDNLNQNKAKPLTQQRQSVLNSIPTHSGQIDDANFLNVQQSHFNPMAGNLSNQGLCE